MNEFNIIAVDPGNNVGITIYTIDVTDYTIKNIISTTVTLSNRVSLDSKTPATMIERIHYLNAYFYKLLETYKPLLVVSEAAFLNSRFPKAVMQLSQYIASVELAIHTYDKRIKLVRYPPKRIKKLIGATGNADKLDMLRCVRTIKDITEHIDMDNVSEHEVDSLAIGYVCIAELREYPDLILRT